MSNQNTLTSADVAKLLQDTNDDNRAAAAVKVAKTFENVELSANEREIAEDIFRLMLKDAAVRVRAALSESLKDNPDVPHDVALTLAKDVKEVSVPIVMSSDVLTDEDLVAIVNTRGELIQNAVAGRKSVSPQVSEAIAEQGSEHVVATLMGNDGAEIAEHTFKKVLDKFADSDLVKEPMVQRKQLPISVSERLVTMVSDQLRQHIMTHHEVSPGTASDLLMESRERATVTLLEGQKKTDTVVELVNQLHQGGRLTASLIVRALCMGDTTFFEAALAKRVGIPVVNAYKLVHDKGGMGLQRLFEAAEMPNEYLSIAKCALEVADEMSMTAGDNKEMFRQLMIERVLTTVEDDVDMENFDYLVGKLSSIENEATTVH
ncbi:DUF2336 domain-containing protein [Kordiimonas sp. SCSIO 12610]|uniref:DUF2336 domain-containing protein n=1 Tax=Kordiimonas sp. SCSIO 12610 TaxID=2829597 RepID=UPI00210A278E|nr:DUF2336 domain-containing protein [Kordiimonas sp. SCSIO 12610]UTW54205.1 DUF2336 domain-containing protein [Kordiimonas sp. SCSIO 12610]